MGKPLGRGAAPVPVGGPARAVAFALGAAAAGAVLLVSVRFDGVFSAPKLAAAAAASALACWAVFWGGVTGSVPGRRSPLDLPLAAFAAAAALSAAFSVDRPLSVLGHQGFYAYGLLAAVVYLGLYHAAFRALGTDARPYFRAVAGAAAACALLGVLQWAGLPATMALEKALPEGRVYSTLGSPVYLGAVLALALPLCAALAAGEGRDRALGFVSAALCAAALVLTQSRGAWLGAAAGLAVWAWACGRAPARGRLLVTAAAALAAGLAGAFLLRQSAQADSARVEVWKSAVAVAVEHPVTGVGVGAFENALRRVRSEGFVRLMGAQAGQASAHNDLLEVAATMGLVGLAAYLWCLWGLAAAARAALATPGSRDAAAAALGALAALFVAAKANPTPFAAVCAAAPLVGLLASLGGDPEPRPHAPGARPHGPGARPHGPARLAAALLASVACWGALRLAHADHWFLKGRVYRDVGRVDLAPTSFDAALRLNPYETKFRMATVAFLMDLSARVSGREKADLLAAARRVSAEGLARRPGHVDSWQTEGVLLARIAKEGDASAWASAAAALDRALALDPWFPTLLAARVAVAEGAGDAAALELWRGRRRRLAELSGGRGAAPRGR